MNNPYMSNLQAYPFERLAQLNAAISPASNLDHIPLSLGEPKHPPPDFVVRQLSDPTIIADKLGTYPATRGSAELRQAMAAWLSQRFTVKVDPESEVLPVNGTREGLFAFAQAMLSHQPGSRVLMPNPFYQIYEGAALLAGAQPYFVDNRVEQNYQQDFSEVPDQVWRDTELVYLCSPGNPTGQVMGEPVLAELIELAHRYDFLIAADECYSEIYFDEQSPPTGLLSVSDHIGNPSFSRCVVFHSLSKRSNLPGLRSGLVAGDAAVLTQFLRYRTYHGCALGAHHQYVSTLAWQDEQHVHDNRERYRTKFAAVEEILQPHYDIRTPQAGFYHWLPTPIDDQRFCQGLLERHNVTVMPGSFLARDGRHGNPGQGHVRVAWVAGLDDCIEAAQRLAKFAQQLSA